jgi:iodotyrosine deiodinase
MRSETDLHSSQLPYIAQQASPERGCTPDQIEFSYENTQTEASSLARAQAFTQLQNQRRSLRFYDTKPFPVELLLQCIETGGTAPSGAHQQPWHFSVVRDAAKKAAIREAVEREEQVNYDKRMKQAWKDDLAPIFKNSALHKDGLIQKPYLTEAPFLVVVTEVVHGVAATGAHVHTHIYI